MSSDPITKLGAPDPQNPTTWTLTDGQGHTYTLIEIPVDGVADEKACICPRARHTVGPWTASYRSLACPVHGDSPDPAAAVTADEGEPKPGHAEPGCTSEVFWADGSGCVYCHPKDITPHVHKWVRSDNDGESLWRCYCTAFTMKAPTAPPVANEWRKTAEELPQFGRSCETADITEQTPYKDRIWTVDGWTVDGKIITPDARWYRFWRYIVEPSASDTVEGDGKISAHYQTMTSELYRQQLAQARAERDRLAATCADYERTVTQLRAYVKRADAELTELRGKLTGAAAALRIIGDFGQKRAVMAAPEGE